MAYFAAQIANYFVERGRSDGVKVDPLKVQKLVYLAHGWHLLFLKEPLIEEQIEAWRYGPVVPDLYYAFRKYGSQSISAQMKVPDGAMPMNVKTENFLSQIWKAYGRWTGIDLSMFTHEPGYAWDLARRTNETPWNDAVIDDSLIRDEFRLRQTKSKNS